ncbi:MAG: DUF6448 family protein [Balneolales bacterium]
MFIKKLTNFTLVFSALLLIGIFVPNYAHAHCDAIDGPVVIAAKKALENGNVNLVLVWVLDEHDEEIRQAFAKTRKVRGINEEVKELADRYFFETLVRIHREGEGAPYTGLIPEGVYKNPIVEASDHALESGSLRELRDHLVSALEGGLHNHYDKTQELKNYDINDVQGGREFVEAYVKYIHYVKPIHQAIANESSESAHSH